MKSFLAILAVLVLVFVAIGLAQGWINFTKVEDKTTIEIETNELEQAAERAKEGTKKLLNETGEALEKAGRELDESINDPSDATREREPVTP
jgi:hypothetical protein